MDRQRGNISVALGLVAVIVVVGVVSYYFGIQNKSVNSNKQDTVFEQEITPSRSILKISPTQQGNNLLSKEPENFTQSSNIRQVSYSKTDGWVDFNSSTGYTISHPSSFYNASKKGETLQDGRCSIYFGNDAGGILSVQVTPYNGGSRRELFFSIYTDEYTKQQFTDFEDVLIQGKKSLIIQPQGPKSSWDYGVGVNIVIPMGNTALILGWDNRSKDDSEVIELLQSVKLNSSLSISSCGR